MENESRRFIGIVHRVKRTAEGEARPTMVCVASGEKKTIYELETVTDELDFKRGILPVEFREPQPEENLSLFLPRQLKWRKIKKGEDVSGLPADWLKKDDGALFRLTKVPCEFDGLRPGDTVVMLLGGSGDKLAYCIANASERIGCRLLRIAPARFKDFRCEPDNKTEDHILLTEVIQRHPELFQPIIPRDLETIRVRCLFNSRQDAMKDRIASAQRLWKRTEDHAYFADEDLAPELEIEDLYRENEASSRVLQAGIEEEKKREAEMRAHIRSLEIWQKLFAGVEGCGERIAAPIIAFIGDIRRFPTAAKFKAYCGVAPTAEGEFRRQRRGGVANWSGDIRQAMYLLFEQAIKRPNSVWGQVVIAEKARLRQKYPEVVVAERDNPAHPGQKKKVKLYTDGHIHNKARWHVLGKFCEWLYKEWAALYANEPMSVKEEADAA